ncbi:hypothetical protein AMS68_001119 [Peltaster fructicola]|uniref:Uncharacterized protein n=1 Tax=Peltaster fructicola TaxID=286661 RepID=A0A6H0XLH4_9PEZI|nr:hypothetical protein AMS68_001119 [Peltaster fructicola]
MVDSPEAKLAGDITSVEAQEPVAVVVAPQHHNKKSFNTLPHDVKALIIQHIARPTDLKNVCLVSHELHEIAIRYLYRNVNLDLGCANDCRLSAFLSPHNKGLQHIRQVRLYLANVPDRCNQEQQASFATSMLLEFLPENILEEFSWCPWRPFSADNLLLLYKKQKRMKWMEVMDLDRSVLADVKEDKLVRSGIFDNARKLALYPENLDTLNTAGYYVEQTAKQLDELIIHANFATPEDGEASRGIVEPRVLNDSATEPGLLTRTLFAPMLPFESCTPLSRLTAVRLHRINLRYAADTWCKVINFEQCKNLRFYHCPGADSMFGQLCKSAHLPKKLKTLEFQHRDNAENEALLALDGFLCVVQGLKELIIDLHGVKSLPSTAGICKQSKTLELLNVHASNETGSALPSRHELTDAEELVYSGEDFDKICKACSNLVQMSCAWPTTSLIRSRSEEWKQFESAVTANLKHLITLHISTWPNNKPSGQLLPRQVYEQLLQGLATRLLELSLEPKVTSQADAVEGAGSSEPIHGRLRLLAFGIHDKIYEREDSNNQAIYIRSSAVDAEGRSKIYAAQIGWCLRQFVEPRSDVLESVLGREVRPPVRPDGREFALDDGDGWDDD